jgi:hypothetical protein
MESLKVHIPGYDAATLQREWSGSKAFRRLLIAVGIYALLRLLTQFALATSVDFFPDDLRIYLDAAHALQHGQSLYPPLPLERMEFYQYAPSFALAFRPFLWLPRIAVALLHTLLHVVIYALLYIRWDRLFRQFGMERARTMLARTLPVWLVFAAFWNDLAYLNVYLLMALLATLLIDAVLNERLGWSLLWLSVILQIKPQWAFAVAIPLLLGRYRFFFKVVALAVVAYAAVIGITLLAVGSSYGWQQYRDYLHLLTSIGNNYPWRGPDKPYLGYNHSIVQTVVYVVGIRQAAFDLALVIRAVLLAPLAILGLRCLLHPVNLRGSEVPRLGLDLAFALYTATFIWLDVVWELSLGIALFTYLLATLEDGRVRKLVWAIFLVYALVDFWQIVSFAVLGEAAIAPGPYVLTDPSIYVPLIMIVAVLFYAVLVRRLWVALAVVPDPIGYKQEERLADTPQ